MLSIWNRTPVGKMWVGITFESSKSFRERASHLNQVHGACLLLMDLLCVCFLLPQLGALPLASQEAAIVEDLLYVLIGVDGRYITAQPLVGRENRSFLVDPNLDMSVKELVARILPVAASYSIVTR